MTLYQFRLLSKNKQAEAVWQGEFFLLRETIKHTILLYKVDSFYVEVYYNNDSNVIEKFNSFSSKKRLELYFHLQMN
jgi:hypothetical protein